MTKVALTGGNGFLGWHTRLALRERGAAISRISVGDAFALEDATRMVGDSDRLVHIAGVNRGTDEEVHDANILFAEQLAGAILAADSPPAVVVYANSTQSTNGSVYGEAKLRAGDILRVAAESIGAQFEDVALPNLFGEHGRPFYNAVTATFCHLLAQGDVPVVQEDKELCLLHAQNAADLLIGNVPREKQTSLEVQESVSGLLQRLEEISMIYKSGEVPDVSELFSRDLFNTYRSYAFANRSAIPLARHADARGAFFEIVRSHGGPGQSSFSTTVSGISRGDHYHRRKIERFTVLAGEGTIKLRKVFSDDIVEIPVSGATPMAVDMPTGWAHRIRNTGQEKLYTSFWTNDIFDPANPDTIPEVV